MSLLYTLKRISWQNLSDVKKNVASNILHAARKGKNLKAIRTEFRMEAARLELCARTHSLKPRAIPRHFVDDPHMVIGLVSQCMADVESVCMKSAPNEDDIVALNRALDEAIFNAVMFRYAFMQNQEHGPRHDLHVVSGGSMKTKKVDRSGAP